MEPDEPGPVSRSAGAPDALHEPAGCATVGCGLPHRNGTIVKWRPM
ncbi:MAG: hypothetical protein MZV70_60570 [Desulfobacterales bacterium]|nr:hypothetical protein [Desulfobacterales bacterium]